MANRQERRAAEAKARKQFSKEDLMTNWRNAQAEAMQLRKMYREVLVETEQLRQRAIQTQFALLCAIEASGGSVKVDEDTVEYIESGAVSGWRAESSEGGINLIAELSENFEDDAE